MKLWVLVGLVVAASGGWLIYSAKTSTVVTVERPDEPPIVWMPADDPALQEAVQEARRTVDTLLAALAHTDRPPRQAQLKVRIEEGSVAEHVWLVNLSYDRGMIYGVLGNDPLRLREWRRGDPAMVDPSEITDWLLIDEQGLQGGYTLRAAHDRIPPAQLEEFNASFVTHFGVDPKGFFDGR